MTLEMKRKAALEYLRNRGIYLLDGKFKPTSPAATDVRQTITRYLKATNQQKFVVVEKQR